MEYKTRDLYEGAFLYAVGKKLLRLDAEGNTKFFVFDNSDGQTTNLVNSYWSRDAIVVAKEYSDAVRTLKDRLFSS